MMSQQRTRKAGGAAVEPSRGRQSVVKASGDSMSSNVQAKQPTVRSTSKSKIPKSLRYDLENALVGLCDVWFEEIKPHLVRNNIKVHVHGGGAGPGSGDHQRLPPGAPDCSHLDPALSAGACELCRLLFNAANSIESAVSQAASVVPPGLPPATSLVAGEASGLPFAKSSSPKKHIPTGRRTPRPEPRPHTKPQNSWNWCTPRLCRTYSILTPRIDPPARRLHTADPQKNTRRKQSNKRRPKKINKSTQTPVLRKPEIIPAWEEEPWRTELYRMDLLRQELLGQNPNKQELLEQESCKQEPSKQRPSKQEPSRLKATSPSCLRCPATTTLCTTHRGRKPHPPASPLFQDDLINIIAEKNDKQLRVLFRSPTRIDQASSLNLVQMESAPRTASSKRIPWR